MPTAFKPTLVVVAGPNGSGKTSFLTCMADKQRIIGEWINPDEIAQRELAGWNDRDSTLKAAVIAEQRREKALAEQRDFTFETVLSQRDKIDFLAKAKDAGYFVRAYFIATESPEINAARVARRVMQGGHTVDIEKIISRYYRSIGNLPALARLADVTQVFDNSLADRDHRHMFSFVAGTLHKQRLADQEMPTWGWRVVNTMQAEHLVHRSNERSPLSLDRQIVASQHEQDSGRRVMLLEHAAQGVAALQADVSRAGTLTRQAADLAAKIERTDQAAGRLGPKFAETFTTVYREPGEAINAWNNAVKVEQQLDSLFLTMQTQPNAFGKLRGNSVLGIAGAERKEAVGAVTALVEAGRAYFKAVEDASLEKPQLESSRLALLNDPIHYRAAVAEDVLVSCDIAGLRASLGQARAEAQKLEMAGWVQTASINMSPKILTPVWNGVDSVEQQHRQEALAKPEGQQALFNELARRDPAIASQWQQEKAAQEAAQAYRGPEMSR